MKANSIRLNAPDMKLCLHQKGLTVIVTGRDSIYFYSGGRKEKPQMLAFNPKAGQLISIDENAAEHRWSAEQMEQSESLEFPQVQFEKVRRLYQNGLRLLAAAHYVPPRPGEEKIQEWIERLGDHPAIEKEKLQKGNCLVAAIWGEFSAKPAKVREFVCRRMGDFTQMVDQSDFTFVAEKDQDLDYGIHLNSGDPQKLDFFFCPPTERYLILGSQRVVEITREEAKRLREFLPPVPVNRFLQVHEEKLEEVEEQRKKKIEAIRRKVCGSRQVGTVEI